MCVYVFAFHITYACLLFVLILLLPAVDDLVHVVLSGEPASRLLRSTSLLALLPLSVPVLQCRHQALLAAGGPQADAQALVALLHVVLDALLPPLLLSGILVALLEQVPGVVVQLHVQLVELLYTLDLLRREQEKFSWVDEMEKGGGGREQGRLLLAFLKVSIAPGFFLDCTDF